MKVALIQLAGGTGDKTADIALVGEKIREAAKNGVDFAVLPEMFCCPYDNACFRDFGETADGQAQTALSALAKELGIYIVGGSIPEIADGKVYNSSFVYDRVGRELARHRKVHLFNIDVAGGQRFFESDTLSPGNRITTFDTEFGVMGLCICFDLRFEELARCMTLRGAKCIFVPAAFNMTTGPPTGSCCSASGRWTTSVLPWGSLPHGTQMRPMWLTATPLPWTPGERCCAAPERRRRCCTQNWTFPASTRYGNSSPSSPPGGRICTSCKSCDSGI